MKGGICLRLCLIRFVSTSSRDFDFETAIWESQLPWNGLNWLAGRRISAIEGLMGRRTDCPPLQIKVAYCY
jgi:hypothetical protein